MNSNDIKESLELVHSVFPLPTEDSRGEFKGTHGIHLDRESGRVSMGIWILDPNDDVIKNFILYFDNEPMSGNEFRLELERVKLEIAKILE